MPRQRTVLSSETQRVLELVRAGNIRELDSWTKKGNSLRFPELKQESSVLSIAAKTGFYSLVEFVLHCEKWELSELACALNKPEQRFLQNRLRELE